MRLSLAPGLPKMGSLVRVRRGGPRKPIAGPRVHAELYAQAVPVRGPQRTAGTGLGVDSNLAHRSSWGPSVIHVDIPRPPSGRATACHSVAPNLGLADPTLVRVGLSHPHRPAQPLRAVASSAHTPFGADMDYPQRLYIADSPDRTTQLRRDTFCIVALLRQDRDGKSKTGPAGNRHHHRDL